MKKKIIIICGVSGSGKDTLIKMLLEDSALNLKKVITFSSRPGNRDDDIRDKIYNFISLKKFEKKIQENFFFEHEKTHGYYYGTPRNAFDKPGNYILQIDIRGALNVKKTFPETLIVFIDVPIKQIIGRLKARGESKENIKIRLQTARRELRQKNNANLIINNLNGQINKAYEDLKKTVAKYLSIV